jgi:hypothetical protein
MTMPNKLYEFMSFDDAHVVLEKSENGKDLFMKGIFIQGDVKNQNQRVYPITEINKAVIQINERISKGETVLGELDHPEELSINLDRGQGRPRQVKDYSNTNRQHCENIARKRRETWRKFPWFW